MQTSDIVKLVNAGFTKEDIVKLASSAQPQTQPLVQPQVQPQVQTQPLVQPQVQPLVQPQVQTEVQTQPLVQPQVQTLVQPQVDYKMLYETQKQMLSDLQALNQRMNVGAPIDTVESVMKDFLGGENNAS